MNHSRDQASVKFTVVDDPKYRTSKEKYYIWIPGNIKLEVSKEEYLKLKKGGW